MEVANTIKTVRLQLEGAWIIKKLPGLNLGSFCV